MKSIEERIKQAELNVEKLERDARLKQRNERISKVKTEKRRNYIIGELFSYYFPEVKQLIPGTTAENKLIFLPLEAFLKVLSADSETVKMLSDRVQFLTDEDEQIAINLADV